jgi:hypothetical protein
MSFLYMDPKEQIAAHSGNSSPTIEKSLKQATVQGLFDSSHQSNEMVEENKHEGEESGRKEQSKSPFRNGLMESVI